MKPTATQLAYCLTQVTRFIPSPAQPRAEAQASKWGLKVGQLMRLAEVVFTVTATDSLGLTMEAWDGTTCRLTDKAQLEGWAKIKKPRKAKKNVSEGESLPLFGGDP